MDSFSFFYYKEFLNPTMKIKDVQQKIKNMTGINEKNQRIKLICNLDLAGDYDDNKLFWDYIVLDVYEEVNIEQN